MIARVGLAAGMVLWAGVALAAEGDKETPERAFAQRAKVYLDYVSSDLDVRTQWAKEHPEVGDPHKYVMPPIVARLAQDPKDEAALSAYRWLMEVDKKKGDRGLYHFAAYLRTRMYFQFQEHLPRDVRESMVYDVTNFFGQLRRGGTENHTWMSRCSGYLWTDYLPEVAAGKIGGNGDNATKTNQEYLKNWLKTEVKKLYLAGQGEYDSSTYITFSANSMTNVFDFTKDQKMRDLARAHLEWEAAAMAVRYFHGMNMGPEARGFAHEAVSAHTDTLGWLWWGGSQFDVTQDNSRLSKHASVCAALSKFRPHPATAALARKEVKLPFEVRASKPTYWGPRDNKDQEYLYISDEFAMGTLYSPEDGVAITGTILPQTTMFKAAVRDKGDVRAFGMANGYHGHFPVEGRTPFDQYHQKRAAAINVCYVNPDVVAKMKKDQKERVVERSVLAVPLAAADPVEKGGWYFWQVNKAYVAARPLNGKAAFGPVGKPQKNPTHRFLVSPGTLTGWVVQMGQQPAYATLADFQQAVLEKTKLDVSQLAAQRTATFTSLDGDVLQLTHTGAAGGKPEASTNGTPLVFADWPVYESPYLNQKAQSGVMTVTDGTRSLTIDYSGEWPVFRE